MTKPKPKPKTRQWKLKGWVAVATADLVALGPDDIGEACREFRCGRTRKQARANLRSEIQLEEVEDVDYTILRLDIVATAR